MYTFTGMPKKTNIKGDFKHFQLKLYGEEIKRWEQVLWRARERANRRRKKVTDADVNRALLNMKGALDWLVTDKERRYFQGHVELKLEVIGRPVSEDDPPAPTGRLIRQKVS